MTIVFNANAFLFLVLFSVQGKTKYHKHKILENDISYVGVFLFLTW